MARDFDIDGTLGAITVDDLLAVDDGGYRDMVAYLSGMDLIGEINLYRHAVDEPLRWLLRDGRALKQTYTGDWIWLRLLDVPAALSARGCTVPGRVVVEVIDGAGGYAAGRYLVDGTPEGTSCTRTTEFPDVTASAQALAGAYLGGSSLLSRAITAEVSEERTGALALFDAMLQTPLAPANVTGF